MRLLDRTALVTGGGTGIGLATARALVAEGARVAIASRDASRLTAVARELDPPGERVMALQMDVTDRTAVARGAEAVAGRWGRIDILVNNAGLSGITAVTDPDETLWQQVLATNLTGTYVVTKLAVRHMKDHAHGRVINLSSVLGRFGVPGYAAYCASKHGVIGLTRSLALELAPRGITVNALCPGWVETAMARQGIASGAQAMGVTEAEFRRQAEAAVPLKRFMRPDEIAQLAVYVASDAADGMTGQALNLCGGATMD
jgi:NAD(P)-dependent dehydrogenase (short-subunit alcohol dehydrogenase family)